LPTRSHLRRRFFNRQEMGQSAPCCGSYSQVTTRHESRENIEVIVADMMREDVELPKLLGVTQLPRDCHEAVEVPEMKVAAMVALNVTQYPFAEEVVDLQPSQYRVDQAEEAFMEYQVQAADSLKSSKPCAVGATSASTTDTSHTCSRSAARRVYSDIERRKQRERALQKLEEEEIANAQVKDFLKRHGFSSVCDRRRNSMMSACPLHLAVRLNDGQMVRWLLRAGADPQGKDSLGRSPLSLACKFDTNGSHKQVVDALAEAERLAWLTRARSL